MRVESSVTRTGGSWITKNNNHNNVMCVYLVYWTLTWLKKRKNWFNISQSGKERRRLCKWRGEGIHLYPLFSIQYVSVLDQMCSVILKSSAPVLLCQYFQYWCCYVFLCRVLASCRGYHLFLVVKHFERRQRYIAMSERNLSHIQPIVNVD